MSGTVNMLRVFSSALWWPPASRRGAAESQGDVDVAIARFGVVEGYC